MAERVVSCRGRGLITGLIHDAEFEKEKCIIIASAELSPEGSSEFQIA